MLHMSKMLIHDGVFNDAKNGHGSFCVKPHHIVKSHICLNTISLFVENSI